MLLPDVRPLHQSVDPPSGLGCGTQIWVLDLWRSLRFVARTTTGAHGGLAPGRREPTRIVMLYAVPLAFWLYLNMSLEDSSVIL